MMIYNIDTFYIIIECRHIHYFSNHHVQFMSEICATRTIIETYLLSRSFLYLCLKPSRTKFSCHGGIRSVGTNAHVVIKLSNI